MRACKLMSQGLGEAGDGSLRSRIHTKSWYEGNSLGGQTIHVDHYSILGSCFTHRTNGFACAETESQNIHVKY